MDRRAILMLGLSGASSLVLDKASGVLAADDEGVARKTINEFNTMIPGFKKIRVRESTFQAGASVPVRNMSNAMICECTLGSLEITNDGRTFTANKVTCGRVEKTARKEPQTRETVKRSCALSTYCRHR